MKKIDKIFVKILSTIATILVVLIVIYFVTVPSAFDGTWNHTYFFGSILFFCILGLIGFFINKMNKSKIKEQKIIKDFEKDHPERKEDEVYITNTDEEDYHDIGWKTKRHGIDAYDLSGKKFGEFPRVFPVFVKISEIKQSKDGEEILKKLLP